MRIAAGAQRFGAGSLGLWKSLQSAHVLLPYAPVPSREKRGAQDRGTRRNRRRIPRRRLSLRVSGFSRRLGTQAFGNKTRA
jgi:hypothetical protein